MDDWIFIGACITCFFILGFEDIFEEKVLEVLLHVNSVQSSKSDTEMKQNTLKQICLWNTISFKKQKNT